MAEPDVGLHRGRPAAVGGRYVARVALSEKHSRGIGVTPILSIADHLKSQDIPFELHYLWSYGSPGAFKSTIEQSRFVENTKFYFEATEQTLDAATLLADHPEDTQLLAAGASLDVEMGGLSVLDMAATLECLQLLRAARRLRKPDRADG